VIALGAAVNLGQALRVLLQTVGWRDIVDVAVISFLIYRLLVLIRGTQAVQLLIGLLVIGALGVVADILNLPVLSFLYRNGGQIVLIAVIVLFQPELRRALDQMGRLGRIRYGRLPRSGVELRREVDELVRATVRLSERHIGALIVLQASSGLEEVSMTGVRLEAVLSAEALLTIFFPNSPLHDGAVVVRDGRLVAAGCVLPLAGQVGSAGRVGTRHRAAVGLSQVTDAAVLVVSEETGQISVAQGGTLVRALDAPALATTLGLLLGLPVAEGSHRSLRIRPRPRPTPVERS